MHTSPLRLLALWLGLFAVYVAALALDGRVTGPEAHHLLVAESIVSDGDVDLADEYASRAWSDWYGGGLEPRAAPTREGRIHEPQGVGFALLTAPAYAVAGVDGVRLFLAALAALAFVFAAGLARRLVPEPWATRATVLVAVSPPALDHATTVLPELAAGSCLAGAAFFVLRMREAPRTRDALLAAALLSIVPWLGVKFVPVALPLLFVLLRWTLRRGRRFVAFVSGEVVFASLIAYVTANDILFGGPTPYSAAWPGAGATGIDSAADVLDRVPRLATLWIDPEEGLLLRAPILALAFLGGYLLWRSRRERLARVVAEQGESEVAAALLLGTIAVAVAVVAFGAPRLEGAWPPARHLAATLPLAAPLAAWGLRRAPRTGALLGAVTVVIGIWELAT